MSGTAADSAAARWAFVPVAERRPVGGPVAASARRRLAWLRHLMAARRRETPMRTIETSAPPVALLDRLVPSIDWEAASAALDDALTPLLERNRRVAVVAGGGLAFEVVTRWAAAGGRDAMAEPSPAQLLAGGIGLDARSGETDAILIVPRLERCYLRHADGLAPLRALVQGLRQRGSALVGCDPWAWAFLDRVLGVAAFFDDVLSPVPFDAARLEPWLRGVGESGDVVFRVVNNSARLFAVPDGENGPAQDPTGFMAWLASVSRGDPLVARAVWRHALRVAGQGAAEVRDLPAGEQTVWVEHPAAIPFPEIPRGSAMPEAMVLLTLLAHAGLPEALLFTLLPAPSAQTLRTLHRLGTAGVVEVVGDQWRVSLLALGAARRFVNDYGLIVDSD